MLPPRYHLEKPDLRKINPKEALSKLELLGDKFRVLFEHANVPEYLYWDKLKYRIPSFGLGAEEGWLLIRQFRDVISTPTFIKAEDGTNFTWIRLRSTDEYLHKIDMHAGGQIFPKTSFVSDKNQYILHGIMEEAIASSQLEGAHTTRAAAKKMLMEKRPPQNESEQMILNNYKTITAIEAEYTKYELSTELIFSLHRQLTEGTHIPTEEIGRLRRDSDEIVVQGLIGTEEFVSHVPPGEAFLREEIKRVVDFANDKEGEGFVSPVIKAIFLHFWIGYLHPFTDGNGRLARALFYWYLLKKGYWTMMYIPISTVIKQASSQYAMAYIYSEQDNFDLTYFYDFHMRKIVQSLDEFESYIARKMKENRKLDDVLGKEMSFNDRQKKLIHYLISDDTASITVTSHSELNQISRQTAAKDLKELEKKGLVASKKEGTFIRFSATDKLTFLKAKL